MMCKFCDLRDPTVLENGAFVAIFDAFPVNPGHLLIVSRQHVATLFDLEPSSMPDLADILSQAKALLDRTYEPAGYNVGANCGTAAGQTVPHFHLHVIPRFLGDVAEPRGGVRNFKPAIVPY